MSTFSDLMLDLETLGTFMNAPIITVFDARGFPNFSAISEEGTSTIRTSCRDGLTETIEELRKITPSGATRF